MATVTKYINIEKIIYSMVFLLMFSISIEGTTALKNIVAFTLALSLLVKNDLWMDYFKDVIRDHNFKHIVIALFIYVLYVLVHTIFISHEFLWSINEFRVQLIYPVIYFFIGVCVAIISIRSTFFSERHVATLVFYSLFLHVIIIDAYALTKFVTDGEILRRFGGFMQSPTYANYVTNIVFAMLVAEIVYRLKTSQSVLMISNKILYVFTLFVVIATFIETVRLGDITLVFLGFASVVVFLYQNNNYNFKRKSLISTTLLIILSLPLVYNILTDPRWIRLKETIPVALDTAQTNMHWRDPSLFPPPKVKSGSLAGNSNYMRIAWARQSLHHIRKDKIGIGFGRDAFGHVLENKYPLRRNMKGYRGMSSHSGVLDLALGIGIPGVVLWTLFIFTIAKKTFQEFKTKINYFSILLLFITAGYFSRSIVDSNIKDHMLLQFMFLVGLYLILLFRSGLGRR